MENECTGFIGKFLGHSFKSYLKKEKFIQAPNISFEIYGSENSIAFIESQRNVYIVKCKRCGKEAIDGK